MDYDPSSAEGLLHNASSLAKSTGSAVDRSLLLKHILEQMDVLYRNLRDGQTPIDEWKALLGTLGNQVKIKWKQREWEGVAEDVDTTGNLLLRQRDGSLLCIPSGEVTLADT